MELTTEQRQHTTELVAALRSGAYKQANDRLADGEARCCLGVACELLPFGHWNEIQEYEIPDLTSPWQHYLGAPALSYYGFNERDREASIAWRESAPGSQFKYAKMNDMGCTFAAIADEIEKDLLQ
jgi:hypothetical protein